MSTNGKTVSHFLGSGKANPALADMGCPQMLTVREKSRGSALANHLTIKRLHIVLSESSCLAHEMLDLERVLCPSQP
jgi:hypothetical protein